MNFTHTIYGRLCDSDKDLIKQTFSDRPSPINKPPTDPSSVVADLLSLHPRHHLRPLGHPLRHRRETSRTADPFAPLPACSRDAAGQATCPRAAVSHLTLSPEGRPDGILVDDEGHPDDIIARLRDVSPSSGRPGDAIEEKRPARSSA